MNPPFPPKADDWRRFLALFAVLNVLLCFFIFRDALWGGSVLAPLRTLARVYKHYAFVDPGQTGMPEVVMLAQAMDELTYDFPLQHVLYESYRQGVIPWWNPYGMLGRPFLADAHINGTDPVRLAAYAALPFALAFNWTLVLRFILCGLGMALLARRLGFRGWAGLFLALTFEFAGCQGKYLDYPWVMGSLLYYPFLWAVWDSALERRRKHHLALASLAVAGIFYSGNLQSHAYLPIFVAAFLFGYASRCWTEWRKVFPLVAASLAGGVCLAAPVLAGQIDLFLHGTRAVDPRPWSLTILQGLASFTSIYPWALGTPRTVDLRNALFHEAESGVGFSTLIGSAALVLAILGALTRSAEPRRERARRAALWLWVLLIAALSTPLRGYLYFRCSGLMVLGELVLAGFGLEFLLSSRVAFRRAGWFLAGLAATAALVTNLAAWVIYPRILPKVGSIVRSHDAARDGAHQPTFPPEDRAMQINLVPHDISFANPAALAGFISLALAAAVLLRPKMREWPLLAPVLLSVNLISPVFYCREFIHNAPIELCRRLEAGGPEQQEAMRLVKSGNLRLAAPDSSDALHFGGLFPNALENLYRVHTVHGYAALRPRNLYSLSIAGKAPLPEGFSDYTFDNETFHKMRATGIARFQWDGPSTRSVSVEEPSLNEIRARIGAGPAATLIWTDTPDPGWSARMGSQRLSLQPAAPAFAKMEIPAGEQEIDLTYRPRFLRFGLMAAAAGALAIGLASVLGWGVNSISLAGIASRSSGGPVR